MVNPDEDDNQSVWQQFMAEIAGQTPQPEVSDGVDRGELRNVPKEMLENNRPYIYNPNQPLGEGALKLLAANTTTASDAPSGSLNAYRASGASVQPAKDPNEVFKQLHPEAATRIQRFFELADERGLGLKPGSMNRDYGTQAKMYANRASNPYPVAPPGGSAHMGFATDFSGYKPEKLQAIRELAKEVGLVYGGNWNGKSFDPVHIQLGPGNEVTRYIQGHIDPKAGSVNWEGVRSTQLPEDFIARAIAAAQGQNVPVKEVKVEGAPNATGTVTAAAEPAEVADAKVEVTQKRSKNIDFEKLVKMLDDSSKGGADMLRNVMQSNAQRQQEQRSRTLSQIAQFDQEQVNKMAEALKGGKAQGFSEGGDVGEGSSSTEGSPAGDASGGFGGGVGGQSGNTAGSSADTTGGSPAGDASGGFGGGVGGASGSGNQGGGSNSGGTGGGGVSDTGGTGFGGDIMGGSFGKSPDVGVTLGTEEMGPAAPTSVAAPTATQVESALATLAAGLIAEAAALSKSSTVDVAETEAETQALEGSNITGGSPAGDASGGFGGGIGSGTSTSTESPSTGDISNGSGAGGNEIIPVSLMTSGPNTLTKLANSLESINEKYGVAPKIEDIVIKNNLAEGGKVKLHDLYYKYAEGGPKLPDRPEYEMTDNPYKNQVVKEYKSTLRDRIANLLAGDEPSFDKQRIVENIAGSRGIGATGIGALDFVPIVGNALGADESLREGDYKGAALAVMPMGSAVRNEQKVLHATELSLLKALEGIKPDQDQAIRVWHGSPYKFNEFDSSKLGTGEGQRLYGNGIYFAQDKNRALEFVGNPEDRYRRFSGLMNPKEEIAFDLANRPNARDMDIISALAQKYGIDMTFDEAQSIANEAMKKRGSLYEVDIKKPEHSFLHWQKPLADQSPEIKKALTPEMLGLREAKLPNSKNYAWVDETGMPVGIVSTKMPEVPFEPQMSGNQIYRMIGRHDPDRSTGVLKDVGVAGNVYIDPKHFGRPKPAQNFVVFNPEKDAEIINRYADGGLVTDNGQSPDGTGRQQYDAYGNVSDSQGGPVHAVQYDPDRINMMAQQLHEGTYG